MKLGNKVNITQSNNQITPLKTFKLLHKHKFKNELVDEKLIQSLVGNLLFITRMGRPDIAIYVQQLSMYCSEPTIEILEMCLDLIQYLINTKRICLFYEIKNQKENTIRGYSDASYGGQNSKNIGISGITIFHNNNLINWICSKQKQKSRCINESELHAFNLMNNTIAGIININNDLKL